MTCSAGASTQRRVRKSTLGRRRFVARPPRTSPVPAPDDRPGKGHTKATWLRRVPIVPHRCSQRGLGFLKSLQCRYNGYSTEGRFHVLTWPSFATARWDGGRLPHLMDHQLIRTGNPGQCNMTEHFSEIAVQLLKEQHTRVTGHPNLISEDTSTCQQQSFWQGPVRKSTTAGADLTYARGNLQLQGHGRAGLGQTTAHSSKCTLPSF